MGNHGHQGPQWKVGFVFKVASINLYKHGTSAVALGLAVAIPLGLWVGGAQPQAVGLIPTPWDKLAHLVVFAVLATAVAHALRSMTRYPLLAGFAVALLVGVSDEWHQMGLVGRSADFSDLLADTLGAALGVAVVLLRRRLCRTNPHPH